MERQTLAERQAAAITATLDATPSALELWFLSGVFLALAWARWWRVI